MFEGFLEGLRSLVTSKSPNLDERRNVFRLICSYAVVCKSESTQWRGTAVDIGLQGMRVRGLGPVANGTLVHVGLAPRGGSSTLDAVRCRVLWSRHYKVSGNWVAGLAYQDTREGMRTTWAAKVLNELGFSEESSRQKRQKLRLSTDLSVEVWNHQQKFASGKVHNIGVGGALIEINVPIPEKATVPLVIGPIGKLAPLEITATAISRSVNPQMKTYIHRLRFAKDVPAATVNLLGKYVIAILKAEK